MRALPPELSAKFGHLNPRQHGNEWHSACPVCGEEGHDSRTGPPDRFHMHAADGHGGARGVCRRCGHFEWADDNYPRQDREAMNKMAALRRRLFQEEQKRLRSRIETLQEKAYWQGWHDAMDKSQRDSWHDEGIADWAIEEYQLGYCREKTYRHGGDTHCSPAMTIPHWEGDAVVNVQFRLISPVYGAGKYRYTAGLPAPLFRTEPGKEPHGTVIAVEGAKKAIVVAERLGHLVDTVVGLPGKDISLSVAEALSSCDLVYLVLDPDARESDNGNLTPAVIRTAQKIGMDICRVAVLPVKPDDALLYYGVGYKEMWRIIRSARPAVQG